MIWWAIVYFLHLAKMNGAKKTESKIEVGVCLATKKKIRVHLTLLQVYTIVKWWQMIAKSCKQMLMTALFKTNGEL